MAYLTCQGKMLQANHKYLINMPATPIPPLSLGLVLKLTVIRNQEKNNIVGDAGSTNLTISAINPTTGVLTVPNLPIYAEFTATPSTWLIKDVNADAASVFCSINDASKLITLNPSTATSGFTIGHNISVFNPFINYEFSTAQLASPAVPTGGGWRSNQTAGGPLFKDPCTGVFKMLFYGNTGATNNQVGLAVSNDMLHWDVSNGDQPVITDAMTSAISCYATGNIRMVDSSFCCMISKTAGGIGYIQNAYFDKDASHVTLGPHLKADAAYGSIEKIGPNYYMLYMDVSTDLNHRNIKAAVSTTGLDGSYNDYQTIVYPLVAPAGTCWDVATDIPIMFNDGHKIQGMFGAQGSSNPGVHAGVGVTNREMVLMDFDASTKLWSIDPLGPTIINPLDWPGAPWCYDHTGAAVSTLIDGSTMWMSISFNAGSNTYQAGVVKLKNFS